MKIKLGNIKGPKGDPGPMGPQGPRGEAGNGAAIPKTEQLLKDQNYLFNGSLDDLLVKLVSNNQLFKTPVKKLNYKVDKDNKTISLDGNDGFTVEIAPNGEQASTVVLPQMSGVPVSAIGTKEITLTYKNLNNEEVSTTTIPVNLNLEKIEYNGQTAEKNGDTVTITTNWDNFPEKLITENASFFYGVKKLNFNAVSSLSSGHDLQSLGQTSIEEVYLPVGFSGYLIIPANMNLTIINGENTEKIVHRGNPFTNSGDVFINNGHIEVPDVVTKIDFDFYKSSGISHGKTFWLPDTSR